MQYPCLWDCLLLTLNLNVYDMEITNHIQGYIEEYNNILKNEKVLKADKLRYEIIISTLILLKKEIIELRLVQNIT